MALHRAHPIVALDDEAALGRAHAQAMLGRHSADGANVLSHEVELRFAAAGREAAVGEQVDAGVGDGAK